jgi:hypothetical protein
MVHQVIHQHAPVDHGLWVFERHLPGPFEAPCLVELGIGSLCDVVSRALFTLLSKRSSSSLRVVTTLGWYPAGILRTDSVRMPTARHAHRPQHPQHVLTSAPIGWGTRGTGGRAPNLARSRAEARVACIAIGLDPGTWAQERASGLGHAGVAAQPGPVLSCADLADSAFAAHSTGVPSHSCKCRRARGGMSGSEGHSRATAQL